MKGNHTKNFEIGTVINTTGVANKCVDNQESNKKKLALGT